MQGERDEPLFKRDLLFLCLDEDRGALSVNFSGIEAALSILSLFPLQPSLFLFSKPKDGPLGVRPARVSKKNRISIVSDSSSKLLFQSRR